MTEYLTIQEAAKRLSVNHNTVRRMLPRLGAVNMAKPDAGKRLIRIPVEGVEKFLAGCEIKAPVAITKASKPGEWHIERRRA